MLALLVKLVDFWCTFLNCFKSYARLPADDLVFACLLEEPPCFFCCLTSPSSSDCKAEPICYWIIVLVFVYC